METSGSRTKSKLQEWKLQEPTKVRAKARQFHPPHKNTKRNFRFEKGKFKPPLPMTTPVEKRNVSKFWEEDGTEGPMIIKAEIGGIAFTTCIWMEVPPQKSYTNTALTGFARRTRGGAAHNQPSYKGKNSNSNPPKIPRTNYSNRFYLNKRWVEGAVRSAKAYKLDLFSWKPTDMTGVPQHIAEHRLNIHKGCLPVRQKKRGQVPERNKAIYEEVENHALQGPEVNYTPMEILILDLILSNLEVTRRLLKWRFELEEHDIHYRPRTSVKGKILADFIIERPEDDPTDTPMEDKEELLDPWILFTDGSSCIDGSGAGLIITSPKGMEFTYALRFRFDATDNEAEYEALIARLRIAEQMRDPSKIKYLEKVKNLTSTFQELSIKQIPRGENKKADALSKMSSTSFTHLSKQVLVEELKEKLIDEKEVLAQILTLITSPWPFYKCGIDIAGLSPESPGKVKFLIVAINYFTNWIEAKPVATITGDQIKKFVWDNIVCRFCLPGEIISDNGNQFRDNPFKDKSLGEEIKAWLDKRSKNWLEEISHVLWAHRTMIKSSNGETLFSLTYVTKAVIPVEIGMPTLRTAEVYMIKNDEALEIDLDLLKEKREQAVIQEANSKAMMENTILLGFATQVSGRETSSTIEMRQTMRKMEASSDPSEKEHMRSRKH
nr:reverse transcriptase domain-containing protein [Tanacetum cinerariifolium]